MSKALFVIFQLMLVWCVNCEPCRRVESVDITNGTEFGNGSIILEGMEYVTGSWYVTEENNETVRLGCPCLGRNCLWKCCGPGQVFVGRECEDAESPDVNPFSPPMFKDTEPLSIVAHEHFFYMHDNELCSVRYLVNTLLPENFIYIQQNGSLLESVGGRSQWHKPTEFCVDMRMTDNVSGLVAVPCYPDDDALADDSRLLYSMYAVGLLLSLPFLLVTFLVYAFIPELRNLHGMCLMAYCMGLIVAYPFLAYLKLHSGTVGVGMTGCVIIAFIVYYAFQSSFFWLNVMCFDIWRTFRTSGQAITQQSQRGYRGGSSKKRQERRRFAMYGAYAWGAPLVLTAIVAFMQFGDLPDYVLKPGLGDMKCWFEDWQRDLLYFFTPVLILVVCNTILFSVTAHRIRSIKQETAILKGSESARSDRLKKDKQRYGLYLKLFMVMGVNWTVELVSFTVGGSNWYWVVVDLSNVILGFFIFLIFVWKRKVRDLVKKKWDSLTGARSATDSMGKWATRTSSAPTEDTRVSSDETALRMKELH